MADGNNTFTVPVCMVSYDDGFYFEAAPRKEIEHMGPKVLAEYHVEFDTDIKEAYDAFIGVDALLSCALIAHLISQAFATGFEVGRAAASAGASDE